MRSIEFSEDERSERGLDSEVQGASFGDGFWTFFLESPTTTFTQPRVTLVFLGPCVVYISVISWYRKLLTCTLRLGAGRGQCKV